MERWTSKERMAASLAPARVIGSRRYFCSILLQIDGSMPLADLRLMPAVPSAQPNIAPPDAGSGYMSSADLHWLGCVSRVSASKEAQVTTLIREYRSSDLEGQALGKRLLNQALRQHDERFLSAYSVTLRAVRFYQASGFTTQREAVDPQTGAAELHMHWQHRGAAR
ncbi:hypothetical protein [Pseudomonas cremoricolorata]|uniref:hypothetical protein n=1 Tax=Pseudomonas cremoricolorata TaxID=157783 RepID=UPI0006765707|nr:hypothetical protein [Pseudomonas cremoricolorata]